MRTEALKITGGSTAEVRIVLEGDELQAMLLKSSAELQKEKELPGFRKGKIPLNIMLERFPDDLYMGVANMNAESIFIEAVKENSLEPVGKPIFTLLTTEPELMTMSCVFHIYPRITLNAYKGLSIHRQKDHVSEEELDKALEEFRDLHRKVSVVERPAAEGDIVYFSYATECDGVSIPSVAGSGASQRLEGEEIIPGLIEALKGRSTGDRFSYETDVPEDHARLDLAGKHITVYIKVEEIKERALEPLTDELVHKYNKDCETVADYREKVRRERDKHLKIKADEAFDIALKSELATQVNGNIPEEMIDYELQVLYANLSNGLKLMGKTIESFMEENNYTEKDLKEISLPTAREEVEFSLALDKIAELENLTVTEDELLNEYGLRAKRKNVTVAELRNEETDSDIIEDLLNEKALKLVRDSAVIIYDD